MKRTLFCSFLFFSAAPAYAGAPKTTVAVLSMQSGAYMEAFSAFQAAYGGEVSHYDLSRQTPDMNGGTKLLVAFGGKAANYPYPGGIDIIYCLAPGVFAGMPARKAKSVKVSLIPDFPLTFAKLKEIQPGLKRLRVLWVVPETSPYAQAARAAGARQGIQVTAVRLESPDSLPGALRRALGAADAIWLAPDPLIVTPQNLRILREFSLENGIPFYGSTKSMTREGAVASLGFSFAEMGKAAAKAAQGFDKGESPPDIVFAEKAELTLNAASARKLGIVFPRSILDEAGYLFP